MDLCRSNSFEVYDRPIPVHEDEDNLDATTEKSRKINRSDMSQDDGNAAASGGGKKQRSIQFSAVDIAPPKPNATMTCEQYNDSDDINHLLRWEKDIEERNKPLTDEELDSIFPEQWYYNVFHFSSLSNEDNNEEQKEREITKLLLKVKNGTPPQRKTALRQLIDNAREFGAGPLFNRILPLLMQPKLKDHERQLLVKVIDWLLYKLNDLVRPYVHKILVVIEPFLIDEDYYIRVDAREIISNLSKAAGLATMIDAMRPDMEDGDEYVRNTTARAFSSVASALGVPALVPFLKAVCRSNESWQARHTGIKIVQQIAFLTGHDVLPDLRSLVEIIEHGLNDENQRVRIITALSLAALAEAAAPNGIESFESVLMPLLEGVRTHRGKVLAAFFKAVGFIIPLMDPVDASCYIKEVRAVLVREFRSPEEEMRRIVIKVVRQCVSAQAGGVDYIRNEICPEFFRDFWVWRAAALDRRYYKQLIETTVEMAGLVGAGDVLYRIGYDLTNESEAYRTMVMETIEKLVAGLDHSLDIDDDCEEVLIDGILYAYQEQRSKDGYANLVMLNGFGAVVNFLGLRVKPYLPMICGTIKWRLGSKSFKDRKQAADLVSRISGVIKQCGEEQLLDHLLVALQHMFD